MDNKTMWMTDLYLGVIEPLVEDFYACLHKLGILKVKTNG